MCKKKRNGLIAMALGVLGCIFSFKTYNKDTSEYSSWLGSGYNYEAPLTGHEIMVIMIAVISVIMIIIGIVLFFNGNGEKPSVSHDEKPSVPHEEKSDLYKKLEQLDKLKSQNLITEEEYKAKISDLINRKD